MTQESVCDDSAMHSWKDLVKVNGSFYCNLSLKGVESSPTLERSVFDHHSDWIANQDDESTIYRVKPSASEPVSLIGTSSNRTVLHIGSELEAHQTLIKDEDVQSETTCHTIKLVIGEPLSLDTSEYVSWDGSQTGPQSGASAADDGDSRDGESEEEDLQCDSLSMSPMSPIAPETVHDELTHSCCRFFDQRQEKLSSIVTGSWNRKAGMLDAGPESVGDMTSKSPIPGLHDKMEHLRREIVSHFPFYPIPENVLSVVIYCIVEESSGLHPHSPTFSRVTFSLNPTQDVVLDDGKRIRACTERKLVIFRL